MMKEIAVIGCRGIPASYGGFESLAENIVENRNPQAVHYTIFCSGVDMPDKRTEHKGSTLRYVNLHANGMQSVLYDIVSMCKSVRGYDTILILGVSGCVFLPILRLISKTKVVTNIDGLEHRREKWNRLARWFLRFSEKVAVKYSDIIIADNKGIQDYVSQTYDIPSQLIAYGGDHVHRTVSNDFLFCTLQKYGLEKHGYAVTVCRVEPENNSRLILEAFAKGGDRLVFIGNWSDSDYSRKLKKEFGSVKNIILLDSIYDLDVLYALRSQCRVYVHGHSAGGTNPSLVEAMHFGSPIFAFDVVYNRETTETQAFYFKDKDSLVNLLHHAEAADLCSCGARMREIARRRYTWSVVAKQYEEVLG